MPIVHSLTLEFRRVLSEPEWRHIIELARALPYVRQLRVDSTGEDVVPMATCLDCGLAYDDFPLDLLLPRSQWLEIHPTDGGVLCAACVVARAAKVPGATAVHAVIEIAPRGVL